jgi:hypothetical protein
LLIESFEKVETRVSSIGEEEVFSVILTNGLRFKVYMNYINPDKSREFSEKNRINASYKSRNDIANLYETHFRDFNKKICVIQFKDSQDRHTQTGEVGLSAIELFSVLRNAILESIQSAKYQDVGCLIVRADKKEPRRTQLYKKLFEKHLSSSFLNIFVDGVSDADIGYNLVICIQ